MNSLENPPLDFSFGKERRLLSKADFLNLRENSKMTQDHLLRVFYKTSPRREETRIGLAVSKKVGNAVTRNRIKRVLREEFRLSPFREKGIDALIVVKPKGKRSIHTTPLLKQSFYRCFGQIS